MAELKRIRIGAMAFTVRVVARTHPDFEGPDKDGLTRYDQCEILLASGLSAESTRDALFHEVLHAWAHASGVGYALATIAKCNTDEERANFDETFVRLLSGSLRPALESAGWTPPKVSK